MALLTALRPGLYAAWREPLTLLGCGAQQWATQHLARHSAANIMTHHADSALALLLLITLNNASTWMCLAAIYGRMLLSWTAVALLACALASLPASEALCHRVLDVPGTAAPLARLHGWLMQ